MSEDKEIVVESEIAEQGEKRKRRSSNLGL